MRKVLLLVVALVTGCASQEDIDRDARLRKLEQETQEARLRESVDAYVANQCAYVKADPVKYGDCNRETRQFLMQQYMQQVNASNAQAAAQAQSDIARNQAILNSVRQMTQPVQIQPPAPTYRPPVTCVSRQLSGSLQTVCQ